MGLARRFSVLVARVRWLGLGLYLGLSLLLVLAGEAQPLAQTQPKPLPTVQANPLQIYAAVSLKNALDRIAKDWAAQGHAPLVLNYAASSTLAQQIAAGAPADVFFSADLAWMDWLAARGMIRSGQRRLILGNDLVLISAAQSSLTLRLEQGANLRHALGDGLLAIADPRTVPAGKYGKAALVSLGLWDQVSDRLAPADHVRAVVQFVARGEAPLGIVYRTDLRAEPSLRLVAVFPTGTHEPIRYPAAVMMASTHPQAVDFLTYLEGAQAQAHFSAEGFLTRAEAEFKP